MVRLTDRPDMTLDVYRGRKTTIQYNHEDPDQTPHYVASDLGLHCLSMILLRVSG